VVRADFVSAKRGAESMRVCTTFGQLGRNPTIGRVDRPGAGEVSVDRQTGRSHGSADAGAPRLNRDELMDPNTDDLKGRAKEAVGDLTDNRDLKREGKTDRASGKAKEFVDDVKDKAEDVIDSVRDKLHRD
jgi:uncharacterized protein YjbJ (UPF0337 family)